LMPGVSAHLLCATPTAHWVEYVDWADAILQQPLEVADGKSWYRTALVWVSSGMRRS
jgi:hypothetical protein